MNWQVAVDAIVTELERASSVEGVFLSGSLVDRHRDAFSDVDLGVASRNGAAVFGETFALRHRLLIAAGRPVHRLERGWDHCRMVAALYGKAEYPPIGLEIDIVFSQLRHVAEQMPYAAYRVLFDRRAKLRSALDRLAAWAGAQAQAEHGGRGRRAGAAGPMRWSAMPKTWMEAPRGSSLWNRSPARPVPRHDLAGVAA